MDLKALTPALHSRFGSWNYVRITPLETSSASLPKNSKSSARSLKSKLISGAALNGVIALRVAFPDRLDGNVDSRPIPRLKSLGRKDEVSPLLGRHKQVAVEFRQVPYAVEDVQAAAKQSGRPHAGDWAAQWLARS